MRAPGATQPRWFSPVIAPDGRRLTLGNWLLTTALPTLIIAPAVLAYVGEPLFTVLAVYWLDLHHKHAIILMIIFVVPNIASLIFAVFCLARLIQEVLRIFLCVILLLAAVFMIWLLFLIATVYLESAVLIFGLIAISQIFLGLSTSIFLGQHSSFPISYGFYIAFPMIFILFAVASFLFFYVLLAGRPEHSLTDLQLALALGAVYVFTGVIGSLVAWLPFLRAAPLQGAVSGSRPSG